MSERAWRYKKEGGEIVSKLFETGADEALESGWFDSPDKVEEKKKRKHTRRDKGED